MAGTQSILQATAAIPFCVASSQVRYCATTEATAPPCRIMIRTRSTASKPVHAILRPHDRLQTSPENTLARLARSRERTNTFTLPLGKEHEFKTALPSAILSNAGLEAFNGLPLAPLAGKIVAQGEVVAFVRTPAPAVHGGLPSEGDIEVCVF